MNNSKMRPELNTPAHHRHNYLCPERANAYWMIRDAVEAAPGLTFGKLHDHGLSCAIGAFWDANPRLAMHTDVIDEVAMINDSVPKNVTPQVRRLRVLEWLNWKLDVLAARTRKVLPPKVDGPAPEPKEKKPRGRPRKKPLLALPP